MVTNLVVTGCFKIGVNSVGKVKAGKHAVSIENEIPFIRYRFDTYDDEQYKYIESMQKTFSKSAHLVEIKLDSNTYSTLKKFESLVSEEFVLHPLAKYVYIDIEAEEAQNKDISPDKIQLLQGLKDVYVDRFMIKDKSDQIDAICLRELYKKLAVTLNKPLDTFGICSSPLSFNENACLTAVKARELLAEYRDNVDGALPTANHQDMNCCGCMRYVVIDSDVEPPKTASTDGNKNSDKSEQSDKPKKKPQTAKKPSYRPGMFR